MKRRKNSFIKVLFIFLILFVGGCYPVQKNFSPDPELKSSRRADNPMPLDQDGVMLGLYPSGSLRYAVGEIRHFDTWIENTGTKVSLAGTYMDLEASDPERVVPAEMEAAWGSGYLPFVKLMVGHVHVGRTAQDIAEGKVDDSLRAWARAYARWSQEGKKRAFIVPLPEMNGGWVSYGKDPDAFIKAFRHIREIFHQEGVSSESAAWVFAPNGWGEEGHEFERYYPGDDVVDVIGFSSYNSGHCSDWPQWEGYEQIYRPYLDRMVSMAPEKPIFIAEMGTVDQGGDKNAWLMDTIAQLSEYPGVEAILYFNRKVTSAAMTNCNQKADHRIFDDQVRLGFPGVLDALSSSNFAYYPPDSPYLDVLWMPSRK